MQCPTCGNTDLNFDPADENGPVECPSCTRVMTREELVQENGRLIEAAVEGMGKEITKDVEKELSSMLKKAFGETLHVKIG